MANAHLTVEQLKARYPEIRATAEDAAGGGAAFVASHLATAASQTPLSVWGELADDAHGSLAMHSMAITPFGQQAQLASKDGESAYGNRRAQLEKAMGAVAAPRTT